jgi:RNA polymerase sigma-70 factor, ECF subfamily
MGSPLDDERSESEIVGRVLSGRAQDFELLVHRYQERLFRFALASVRDADVAADLVQDTFVRAYTGLAGCRDRERFAAWIFRILRNRCLDYRKEHRRRDVPLDERMTVAGSVGLPELDLERSRLREALERAVADLPDTMREAFILKHVHGLSYEEIESLLDVRQSALKMRVARAREALQAVLANEGFEKQESM